MGEIKHIEKTLASCKPSEFLRQTNRVRKSVEKWLTATDLMRLRKQAPVVDNTATKEERDEAIAEQMRKNLSAILDSIMDEHPEETLELLALLCFIEPENVDDYPIAEYLDAFGRLLSNSSVINFFTSLARLEQMGILG